MTLIITNKENFQLKTALPYQHFKSGVFISKLNGDFIISVLINVPL